MATKWVADCAKFPSEKKCDVVITGSDKNEVAQTAFAHAVSYHGHDAKEKGLLENITMGLVQGK